MGGRRGNGDPAADSPAACPDKGDKSTQNVQR